MWSGGSGDSAWKDQRLTPCSGSPIAPITPEVLLICTPRHRFHFISLVVDHMLILSAIRRTMHSHLSHRRPVATS